CGFQTTRRLCRIMQPGAKGRAVAEGGFDLCTQPCMVDDDVFQAGCHQLLYMPDDERLAAHGKQRLGRMVGQGAHAFAASRGENHGAHQKVYPVDTLRSSSRSSSFTRG